MESDRTSRINRLKGRFCFCLIFLDNRNPFLILSGFCCHHEQQVAVKIRVDDIKEQPRVLRSEEPLETFPGLVAVQDAGECEFLSPVTVELAVAREYDHIRVKGNLKTRIRLNCSRCLGDFEADLASVFTMFYRKEDRVAFDEEEVELAEEDLISIAYQGDEIDFAPEIAEQVIMELPLKPLCQESCRGLCPTCGVDLNEAECTCAGSSFSLKFSALKDFKVDK